MYFRYRWLIFLALLALTGCNFAHLAQASSQEEPGRSRPNLAPPTWTPTPLPSATATPTLLPTETPLPTPTPTPQCTETQGRIEAHEIQVPGLSIPMRFKIYLPPCYTSAPQKLYPVLYMLHGQSYDEDQWINLGMGDAADAMISAGEIEPLIIVMPGEDRWLDDAITSKFGPAVTDLLIPWVDGNYPTCGERACRALGGLSRGAAWAMRLGTLHPDLFTALGGHSLALFDGDANYLPQLLARLDAEQRPSIYLDVGDKDRWKDSMTTFYNKLTHIGMQPEFIVQTGNHDTAYWKAHTPEYLRWYAAVLAQP